MITRSIKSKAEIVKQGRHDISNGLYIHVTKESVLVAISEQSPTNADNVNQTNRLVSHTRSFIAIKGSTVNQLLAI